MGNYTAVITARNQKPRSPVSLEIDKNVVLNAQIEGAMLDTETCGESRT